MCCGVFVTADAVVVAGTVVEAASTETPPFKESVNWDSRLTGTGGLGAVARPGLRLMPPPHPGAVRRVRKVCGGIPSVNPGRANRTRVDPLRASFSRDVDLVRIWTRLKLPRRGDVKISLPND
jgi:hypothetical protein